MSGLNPPLVLTPGQHFTFTVTFTPPSPGNYSGSVSVVSDASNPNLAIPLSGTGTPVPQGQLSVVSHQHRLWQCEWWEHKPAQPGTLSATGASVTVSSGTVNGSAFALSGISFPVTIPAGQHVQFTVTFTPSTNGVASGNVSFASDASNSPTIESLTGTGTPPPQHSVGLSWTASTSQECYRLQHLSRHQVGRTVFEDQFGLERQHSLYGHYGRRRKDLLLRIHSGQLE